MDMKGSVGGLTYHLGISLENEGKPHNLSVYRQTAGQTTYRTQAYSVDNKHRALHEQLSSP
jgi:hypothetical protein